MLLHQPFQSHYHSIIYAMMIRVTGIRSSLALSSRLTTQVTYAASMSPGDYWFELSSWRSSYHMLIDEEYTSLQYLVFAYYYGVTSISLARHWWSPPYMPMMIPYCICFSLASISTAHTTTLPTAQHQHTGRRMRQPSSRVPSQDRLHTFLS